MQMKTGHLLWTLLLIGSPSAAQNVAFSPGNGVSRPVLIHSVVPDYTTDALKAGIEGRITLEAVVQMDGSVTDVTVLGSLDKLLGLDDAAVAALKQWRFKPGLREGQPVPVRVTVTMSFTHHASHSWWRKAWMPFAAAAGVLVAVVSGTWESDWRSARADRVVDGARGPGAYAGESAFGRRDPSSPQEQVVPHGPANDEVLVASQVRKDGTGEVTIVTSEHPELDDAVIAAVRQWLFKPATRSGGSTAVLSVSGRLVENGAALWNRSA